MIIQKQFKIIIELSSFLFFFKKDTVLSCANFRHNHKVVFISTVQVGECKVMGLKSSFFCLNCQSPSSCGLKTRPIPQQRQPGIRASGY